MYVLHQRNYLRVIDLQLTGINQCVGIHNERHFVMFMYVASFSFIIFLVTQSHFIYIRAYLVLSTFCFSTLGYQQMLKALGVTFDVRQYPIFLVIVLNSIQTTVPLAIPDASASFYSDLHSIHSLMLSGGHHAIVALVGSVQRRNFCRGTGPWHLSKCCETAWGRESSIL